MYGWYLHAAVELRGLKGIKRRGGVVSDQLRLVVREHWIAIAGVLVSWILAWFQLWLASRGFRDASGAVYRILFFANNGAYMVATLMSVPATWLRLSSRELFLVTQVMAMGLAVPWWILLVKGVKTLLAQRRERRRRGREKVLDTREP